MSRYELGKDTPSIEILNRMSAVAGIAWPVISQLIRFLTAALSIADRDLGTEQAEQEGLPIARATLDIVGMAIAAYRIEEATAEADPATLTLEHLEGQEIGAALLELEQRDRLRLMGFTTYAASSWALAAELAQASARAASHSVAEALQLAELAVEVARRIRGGATRARIEAYCLAFLANALRVATRYEEADKMMAQAWELWRQGSALLPLAEWRLLDLEASLRREQHRFGEALGRLDEALALCDGGDGTIGLLLLNKANVQQQAGDHLGALATLSEAQKPVACSQDVHLAFALRFNMAVNLCFLVRYGEADALLPGIRELAIEQGKELDLLRLDWLRAKVAAGQGRTREAIVALEEVSRGFTTRGLAYEAALASLDLALLLLQERRTPEVRQLALAMAWIFEAKGIAREARAALSLFCEAARNEFATVDLVRRVIAKVERLQSSAAR